MAKYKVGDKVRVKAIKADEEYGSVGDRSMKCKVTNEMARKAGGIVTITEVGVHDTYTRYRIAEDSWFWADGMFEGLATDYKVRCVGYNRDERYFTVGKVYDVVNGTITNDNGFTYTSDGCVEWLGGWYKFERVGNDTHKIVITTDGKTTTARLFDGKELVRKAEAKCSPDDKFDFMVGAELAMERLMDKKPVNPFKVGDFVKIKSNDSKYHYFPVGSTGRVIKADTDGTCEVDGFFDNGNRGNQWIHIEELEKI